MSPVNFQDFRNIAATKRDATISVNHSTGNLQVRDNHVLNRLITWVRNKIRPQDPSTQYIEQGAAYNRFLGAVGKEIRYRDQLGWVEDQLGADTYLKKPLTSRRVGEIMHQLDTRTTEAHRNSLVTAHYMAGMDGSTYLDRTLREKIEERPMLKEAEFKLNDTEREALADNIFGAVMEASNEGRNDIGHAEGNRLAGGLVDGVLNKHEARLIEVKLAAERAAREAEQKAQEAAATAGRQQATATAAGGGVKQDGAQQGAAAAAEDKPAGVANKVQNLFSKITRKSNGATGATATTAATAATAGPQTKDLLDELKQADLPSAVRTDMKKSIKSGGIKSFDTFVQQANQKTYKWVRDNRLGKWYYDALKDSGVRVGNEVTVPIPLDEKVEQQISRSPYPVRYADVKVNVRREITAYIAENGSGATSAT